MEAERARAAALDYPDPICKDKQATDENYDAAVRFTMDHLDRFEMFMELIMRRVIISWRN